MPSFLKIFPLCLAQKRTRRCLRSLLTIIKECSGESKLKIPRRKEVELK